MVEQKREFEDTLGKVGAMVQLMNENMKLMMEERAARLAGTAD